jgi:hypothetical protein
VAVPNDIPQIISIVKATGDGRVPVKREVRGYLATGGEPNRSATKKAGKGIPLYLIDGNEVLLTAKEGNGAKQAQLDGDRVCLPQQTAGKLGLESGSYVAVIDRGSAVALKTLTIEEEPGEKAQVVDYETPLAVRRIAQTNPPPKDLLAALKKTNKTRRLKRSVRGFLRGRESFEAWRARTLLGAAKAADQALRQRLIAERLADQLPDGSWAGKVPLTARRLKELAELGLTRRKKEVRAGVDWLLARPTAGKGAGTFFLTDELCETFKRYLKEKRRFRDRKPAEIALAAEGDPLYLSPCGPRITWPNAQVIETLLMLGFEKHPRVQQALRPMLSPHWCECGFNPFSQRSVTPTEVAEREAEARRLFRYGGVKTFDELTTVDDHRGQPATRRLAHKRRGKTDIYVRALPSYTGPCNVISLNAISQCTSAPHRSFAESAVWQIASNQHAPDGHFPLYGRFHDNQAALLDTIARYDVPVAKVFVLRSMPWIIKTQNTDGSWGDEPHQDAVTLAILKALLSVKSYLPAALRP